MKIEFAEIPTFPAPSSSGARFTVRGESDPLSDVLLCPPSHLAPVPCCSKTRESVRSGFSVSTELALRQHRALRDVLTRLNVTCHVLPAAQEMPDLCFTRDTAVATPWGVVALNPAMPHRVAEVDHVAASLERLGAGPVARIHEGHIEGGDVCIARPGLLVLGLSGERTDERGARAFAERFRQDGWDVLHCRLDPHFLHLDTIFCMLDPHRALACVDVLDDAFLAAIAQRGIRLIPTTYKEARNLGGNILSLDGRTILVSADYPRIGSALMREGFEPVAVDISQFAACGGGIHCLTMPLRRRPAPA